MKRSCQRHTQVFDLPVRRMISLVPTPSALNRTISALQTCLCGVLRSRDNALRRRRSAGLRVMEIPVRMGQNRMHSGPRESPPGFKCQTRSTSSQIVAEPFLQALEPAARDLGIQLQIVNASTDAELDAVFASLTQLQ